jgi:hypothetical protein
LIGFFDVEDKMGQAIVPFLFLRRY